MTRTFIFPRETFLFFSATLLLFLKSPDAILHPQFWAEDGPVFFAPQFFQSSPLLATPYAGYLHTVTRLVAWLATFFDAELAPLVYNTAAIAIDAFCITYVTVRMAAWFPFWIVFFSFYIVPSAGDIFGTVTNVQWFMQFALVTACFSRQRTAPTIPTPLQLAGFCFLILAALSGPFSIVISLLGIAVILTVWISRHVEATTLPAIANIVATIRGLSASLSRVNLGIITLCAVVQLAVLSSNNARTPVEKFLLGAQQQSDFGVARMGSFYSYTVNHPFTALHLTELAVMASIALACLVLAMRRPIAWNGVGCLFVAIGIVQPLLAYLKQRELHTLAATSHYFYMLSVACCWVGWKMMDELRPQWRGRIVLALTLGLIASASLRPDYFRREPLHDLKWANYPKHFHDAPAHPVVVPVNPAPWHFTLHRS